MPFSESIKKEVRQKAAFQCCRCRKIGVEVHHIIPKECDGSDDIENAAPLCPNCHDDFGQNPEKRKVIFEMRDWWYEQVEKMYPTKIIGLDVLEEINSKLEGIHKGILDVSELKPILKGLTDKAIEDITPTSATTVATGAANISLPTLRFYGTGRTNMITCDGCGNFVELENYCSKCGRRLR
jgi:hypothetical protein